MLTLKEAADELGIRPALVVHFATKIDLGLAAKEDGNDGIVLHFGYDQVSRLKLAIRVVCDSRPFTLDDYGQVVHEAIRIAERESKYAAFADWAHHHGFRPNV